MKFRTRTAGGLAGATLVAGLMLATPAHVADSYYCSSPPLTLGNGTKVSDHIHLRGNGYGQGYLQFDRPPYLLGEPSDNQRINSGNGHYNDYSHIPGGQFNGIITWGKSTNWRVGCYVRNGRSARPT
ncbi:hypothetical protein [Streptomyces violascens]|uniref:hypothetical protein n=1 Tax=Streptomyces violascens TaxID=67381 RepID=UPI0036C452AA